MEALRIKLEELENKLLVAFVPDSGRTPVNTPPGVHTPPSDGVAKSDSSNSTRQGPSGGADQ